LAEPGGGALFGFWFRLGGAGCIGGDYPTAATDHAHPEIIRRIAKHRCGRNSIHQACELVRLLRIGTQQPVPSEQPKITPLRDCISTKRWNRLFGLVPRRGHVRKEQIDFWRLKPRHRDIESLGGEKVNQLTELDRQHRPVPARLFGNFIVSDRVGALLSPS